MTFTGQWYDPNRNGEGITVVEYPPDSEHPDGLVLAHFFGYVLGSTEQRWLVCQGVRNGHMVELDTWHTAGPVGNHTEVPAEPITLSKISTGFKMLRNSIVSTLIPLHEGVAPAPEITVWTQKPGESWRSHTELPASGPITVNTLGAHVKTLLNFRIEGDVTINNSGLVTAGRHNPEITYDAATQSGKLLIGPYEAEPDDAPGTYDMAHFNVWTSDGVELIGVTASVMDQ